VETARALAAHGAEVIGTARDLKKARGAPESFAGQFGERFLLVELDLASLASVRPYAVDPERARALWARSEELVGECFD
jgi:NAD(P)-dependent dehydrogenase (short-subunit alcohol dehydrogenase family)